MTKANNKAAKAEAKAKAYPMLRNANPRIHCAEYSKASAALAEWFGTPDADLAHDALRIAVMSGARGKAAVGKAAEIVKAKPSRPEQLALLDKARSSLDDKQVKSSDKAFYGLFYGPGVQAGQNICEAKSGKVPELTEIEIDV